ncbi:MAG: hypothetical protein HQL41_18140, partial [Alphaproteobacteria bacterium]|nr:hypothetical protein [Alphaproteobacteria bacterium]
VMRTRPRFPNWAAEFRIEYLPTVVDKTALEELVASTGELVGIGDWRPRFGRFRVAIL